MQNVLKLFVLPIFKVMFAVEYSGIENVPKEGAIILAGNHPSYLDPVLVALPIRRTIRYMAWDALFKVPVLGWMIRALGAFPVDIRKGKGESAFFEACRVLKEGFALGIFPEGQRSEQGPMGELKTGVARLAIETDAVIVPITIAGASRAWPKWRLLPKPARILVRYHTPVRLQLADKEEARNDRDLQRQIMNDVAESINRSLAPALHSDARFERWYKQPPSHIRIYEYVPLIAAVISSLITLGRGTFAGVWVKLWLPVLLYYLYIVADLLLIKPARLAKWARNSMPVWLLILWHRWLTEALNIPIGEKSLLLAALTVAAFFVFFWQDYFRLQKFVRGLVAVYYLSLALLLHWSHPLGLFVAISIYLIAFSLYFQTLYYPITGIVALGALGFVLGTGTTWNWSLWSYAVLGVLAIAYLQTFITAAYDIRRAGNIIGDIR